MAGLGLGLMDLEVNVNFAQFKVVNVVFDSKTGKMTGTFTYQLAAGRKLPMARISTENTIGLTDPALVSPLQILFQKKAGVMVLTFVRPKTISIPFEVGVAPGILVNNAIKNKKVLFTAKIVVNDLIATRTEIIAGNAAVENWTVK